MEKERGWNSTDPPDATESWPNPEPVKVAKKMSWKLGELPVSKLSVYQKAQEQFGNWLQDLGKELETDNMKLAYHALRGVLFALRDRLTPEEVFDLSAQMPLLIRGLFFEGYEVKDKPVKMHAAEFRTRVLQELPPIQNIPVDLVIRAVMRMLQEKITKGEMADVKAQLPEDLQKLLFGRGRG
jgi:uncharacterized protein (DUF2267 family)